MNNEEFKGVMKALSIYDGGLRQLEIITRAMEQYHEMLKSRCLIIPNCGEECPFWTDQMFPCAFCLRYNMYLKDFDGKFPEECNLDLLMQWKETFDKFNEVDKPFVKKIGEL